MELFVAPQVFTDICYRVNTSTKSPTVRPAAGLPYHLCCESRDNTFLETRLTSGRLRLSSVFSRSAAGLQSSITYALHNRSGNNHVPLGLGPDKMIFFVDDLNLPALDAYNTQSPIALIRQHIDYGHWCVSGVQFTIIFDTILHRVYCSFSTDCVARQPPASSACGRVGACARS